MLLPPLDVILYMVLTGALVGLVSSYFGVGACFIMVPVMIYFLESIYNVMPSLAPLIAFGTNMAIVVPTVASGALRHRRILMAKGIRFPMRHFKLFAIPVGFGSLFGAFMAYAFFESYRPIAGLILKTLFGVVCLIGAYRFLRAKPAPITDLKDPNPPRYVVSGFLSGAFAHFIGIGGGIVYMPVLNALLGVPLHAATPISLATMVIGSSIGAVSFMAFGYADQLLHPLDYPPLSLGWFNLIMWGFIGVSSIALAQVGPVLAHRTSPAKYKLLLAIIYFYIGLRLIVRGVCQSLGVIPIIP
ncbi:MAG: sulfite exporter TauE/SafE family protein [Candidatus Nezhaarchaeales archaeon]